MDLVAYKKIQSSLGEIFILASPEGIRELLFADYDLVEKPDLMKRSHLRDFESLETDLDFELNDHINRSLNLDLKSDDSGNTKLLQIKSILNSAENELSQYFQGIKIDFKTPLDPQGTQFQKSVWKALQKVPWGKTMSYKEQSFSMNIPKSIRAVAAANGKNPIPLFIPCHRILSSQNKLHGFAWGLEMKKFLLQLEGVDI